MVNSVEPSENVVTELPVRKELKACIFFCFLSFMSGAVGAIYIPILSLFLKERLDADWWQIGLYYALTAFIGFTVTQYLAKLSDYKFSRRALVHFSILSGAVGCLFYAYSSSYWLVSLLGVSLFCISSVANAQIFASSKEYALKKHINSVEFSAYMRISISSAWVVTPPIGFFIYTATGQYQEVFLTMLGLYLIFGIFCWKWLPNTNEDTKKQNEHMVKNKVSMFAILKDRSVFLLFVACTILWGCNNLYVIGMPIYIVKEVSRGQFDSLPGVLMSITAFLEIPAMFIATRLARKLSIKTLQLLCVVFGVLFYIGFFIAVHAYDASEIANHTYLFKIFQVLNAIFIGIFGCIGMVYFQELSPKYPGQATTLFFNTMNTGVVTAGVIAAFIDKVYSGSYEYVFTYCGALALIALILILFVRKV